MKWPGFCGPSYTSASIMTDYEMCMNWYPEISAAPNAKNQVSLYPTPGFTVLTDTGYVGCRGLESVNNRIVCVMADQVGELIQPNAEGPVSFISYGTVVDDGFPASIAFNGSLGNQALIASGNNAYCLELGVVPNDGTQTVTRVLDWADQNFSHAGMLDGFGIAFGGRGSQPRIYASAIQDMSAGAWDPTQFLQRTDAPDNWDAMLVIPPDIWLIGEQTGCILYDSGSFPWPFSIRPGMSFRYGIMAPYTLKGSGYSVLWLAETKEGGGMVLRTRGYAPTRVSNYAVEHDLLTRRGGLSSSEAFIYNQLGHTFYVLTTPGAENTWVLDLETNMWHKRGTWNPARGAYDRWRPRCCTFGLGGKTIVGEWNSSVISQMSVDVPTERDGAPIRRLRRPPGLFTEHRDVPIQSVEVYLERGTSNALPPGDDAQIIWRNSNDGGRTWPTERQAPIGRLGDYGGRVRMWGMGVSNDRVSELVVSDPITSWRVTDCFVNNHGPAGRGGGR